jgi:hypothetical protein
MYVVNSIYLLTGYEGIASLLSPKHWLLTEAKPRSIVRVEGTTNLVHETIFRFIMQNTDKRCVILLVFIILRWALNYESNVFRYNKILIDCVFGNSKFVVPSTLTIDLGFASVHQKINSPSKQGDGRTFQEKIVNVNYVIDPKLEMNTIIFLNVIILTKNVSSHCQIISDIDIILLNFLNLGKKQYWRKSVIS